MLSSMLSSRVISSGAHLPLHQACFSALTSLLAFHDTIRGHATSCSPSQLSLGPPSRLPEAASHAHTPARAQLQRRAAAWQQPWQLRHQRHLAGSKAEDFDLISVEVGIARIDGYDDTGFIVNDVQVEGPVLCYGDLVTLWRVERLPDITMQSLALMDLVKPAPALLVVGCGRNIRPLPPQLLAALRERGVTVEVLDTVNAVATFNILNREGRKVVGAMLPLAAE